MIEVIRNFINRFFKKKFIDSRSENPKVYELNKFFYSNRSETSDFWIYGGYNKIINMLSEFNEMDLDFLIQDFYYWNSEDLYNLAEMFSFSEEYDSQNKLNHINSTKFYCEIFVKTNESDSNFLLDNLNYVIDKDKNQEHQLLNNVELKLITLKNSITRNHSKELYNETLNFIEQIKNCR